MATRVAQEYDDQDLDLQDAVTSAFSVPEISDFMNEMQEEVLYAAVQAVNDNVGRWLAQVWPRVVRIVVQRLSEEYIVSDSQRQQMERLGLGMSDSVLAGLKTEVEEALKENLPAYGVQDILDGIETEFLRILKE